MKILMRRRRRRPAILPLPEPPPAGRGFDSGAVNAALDEEAVTIVSVVGSMIPRLLESRGDRPYPPTLRCMLAGGGPVPRRVLEECARRAVPIAQTYGLTETASQCATLSPADALRKLGASGRPLLPNEIRILPEDGDAETSGTPGPRSGEIPRAAPEYPVGEIWVRGPSVTAGYLPDDGDVTSPRAATDDEGWLHTGDLGHLDGEGFLYVLDCRTDLIVSGGENIYPAEVEAVLQAHPDVAEAGVYGMPDERWGQRAVAAVVPRPGAICTEIELRAFCRERLAAEKGRRDSISSQPCPETPPESSCAGSCASNPMPACLRTAEETPVSDVTASQPSQHAVTIGGSARRAGACEVCGESRPHLPKRPLIGDAGFERAGKVVRDDLADESDLGLHRLLHPPHAVREGQGSRHHGLPARSRRRRADPRANGDRYHQSFLRHDRSAAPLSLLRRGTRRQRHGIRRRIGVSHRRSDG